MENEKITLSNGMQLTYDECLENLRNTRDFSLYLELLDSVKDRFIIILSVKDTPGANISDGDLEKLREIGFTQYIKDVWWSYIGVINCGNTVFDEHGAAFEEPLTYENTFENISLFITSKPCRKGKLAEIIINGTDYSLNGRGINLVVYDPEENKATDSITYDGHLAKPTFFHRNFYYSDEFFDSRFFIPQKYNNIWRDAYKKRYYSNRPLKVTEVDNGILLPNKMVGGKSYGGVCDEKFNFIAGHATFAEEAGSNERHTSGSYRVNEEELEYIDETVVFGGIVLDHIGHFMIEYFADGLWYYSVNPDITFKIAFTYLHRRGHGFYEELLRLYGFSEEQIIIVEKPTKFKKIIVPDQASMMNTWSGMPYDYTDNFILPFDKLKEKLTPSGFKKIYFTKSKTNKSNIIGEDYFIEFYKRKGFEIINPEDYSIAEKIQFLMGADEFVTTVGTNPLYAIFCKPTVKLTLLSRLKGVPLDTIARIAEMKNIHNLYCVDVSCNFLHYDFMGGISLMCVTEDFVRYAWEMYHEELDITPEEALKNNLMRYLSYFPKYYSNQGFYNTIKNQKMLTVLQMMSEVFRGEEFDTTGLNLTTNEDNLRNQVKQLTTELNNAKKRVAELENSDIYKTAKLLETSNNKLEKQVENLDEVIKNFRNIQTKNILLENEIVELTKHLEESCAGKEKADKEIAALKSKIDYYEYSRSWRITKPLRSISQSFRRLFGNNNFKDV